MSYRLL